MAKIMVMDDDSALRETLCCLLKEAGHEVIEASDGEQGLSLFAREPSDVVITDIRMPHVSGHDAILKLRNAFPALKIIAMTGGGAVDKEMYCQVAKKLGADRTLTKPFNPAELISTLHGLI